ncbi:hypothetical protein Baya_11627 [Bagarius yarrelli]|uniref:Uncharacterized protein n=1 Tax=Bagarius yarrelli TaxID=175774 RepID=A0A556V2H5_BAGYA|nr:hypothetical protein Baya_11627 [Bagarius yarrelli]
MLSAVTASPGGLLCIVFLWKLDLLVAAMHKAASFGHHPIMFLSAGNDVVSQVILELGSYDPWKVPKGNSYDGQEEHKAEDGTKLPTPQVSHHFPSMIPLIRSSLHSSPPSQLARTACSPIHRKDQA